jgi:hypothetical protein
MVGSGKTERNKAGRKAAEQLSGEVEGGWARYLMMQGSMRCRSLCKQLAQLGNRGEGGLQVSLQCSRPSEVRCPSQPSATGKHCWLDGMPGSVAVTARGVPWAVIARSLLWAVTERGRA